MRKSSRIFACEEWERDGCCSRKVTQVRKGKHLQVTHDTHGVRKLPHSEKRKAIFPHSDGKPAQPKLST